MPFSIACPHCDSKLKSKSEPKTRKLKCPKCSGVIVLPPPKAMPAAPMIDPVEKTFCTSCNNEIASDVKVCKYCGHVFDVSAVRVGRPPPLPVHDEEEEAPPRRRRREPEYDDEEIERPALQRPNAVAHSLGITSLVLGGISLIFAVIPCVGFLAIPMASLGLLMAVIGGIMSLMRNGHGIGFPIGGAALNATALAVALIWVTAIAAVGKGIEKANEQIQKSKFSAPK